MQGIDGKLYDLGFIGLAVMGQNLVINLARRGTGVCAYNRTYSRTEELINLANGLPIRGAQSLAEMVDKLRVPRKVFIMVKAGGAVDAVLNELYPLLKSGDTVVDGGNSLYLDTRRRCDEAAKLGINYLGLGVSGGEEGALNGPSMMAGGAKMAWLAMKDMLLPSAAQIDGKSCCAYMGSDGAGHFVKMTHNGIEYGDMQLICEAYALMRDVCDYAAGECAAVFDEWNKGELNSYLIDITAQILAKIDAKTGQPLVDVILDEAEQKGTGLWTAREALNMGVSAPTIAEAVFARALSGNAKLRAAWRAQADHNATYEPVDVDQLMRDLPDALYAAKLCSYAQGFALITEAAGRYGWDANLCEIALIWRGGCIIRAQFLNRISEAYAAGEVENLLLAPSFMGDMSRTIGALRRVVSTAALNGVAAPCFASALSYYDALNAARLPHNLLQAQRDYFGAHTYRRTDMPGAYHTEWMEE